MTRELGIFDFFRSVSAGPPGRKGSRRASAPPAPASAPPFASRRSPPSARPSLPAVGIPADAVGSLSSPSSASSSSSASSPGASASAPRSAPAAAPKPSLDSATTTESSNGEDEPGDDSAAAAIHNYEVVRELGRGATAVVQLGRRRGAAADDAGALVALKVFRTSLLRRMRDVRRVGRRMVVSTALDKVQVEIAIMKKLHHRNLLNLLEVFDDDTETLVLLLEYAPHGQVMQWHPAERMYFRRRPVLRDDGGRPQQTVDEDGDADEDGGPSPSASASASASASQGTGPSSSPSAFSEDELRDCVRQLLLGLEYLHANHICHRDLKPENILVARDGTYKIADFGVAHFFAEEDGADDADADANALDKCQSKKRGLVSSTAGTYAFMAPEALRGGAFSAYAADVWALGVTVHALAFGSIPFYDPDVVTLFEQIEHSPVRLDAAAAAASGLSPGLLELLAGMLDKDPDARWSIRQCKQHAWVLQGLEDYDECGPQVATTRYGGDMGSFLEPKVAPVEVDDADVMRAVTRVTSLSVLLRVKLGANRWVLRTRQSMEARKRSAMSSGSGSSSSLGGSFRSASSSSDVLSSSSFSSSSTVSLTSAASARAKLSIADVPEEDEEDAENDEHLANATDKRIAQAPSVSASNQLEI